MQFEHKNLRHQIVGFLFDIFEIRIAKIPWFSDRPMLLANVAESIVPCGQFADL